MPGKININWKDVAWLRERQLDGIEVTYMTDFDDSARFLVAFVKGFRWFHGSSQTVTVKLLNPESIKFKNRGINGAKIVSEVIKGLVPYLEAKNLPESDTEIGDKIWVHINS